MDEFDIDMDHGDEVDAILEESDIDDYELDGYSSLDTCPCGKFIDDCEIHGSLDEQERVDDDEDFDQDDYDDDQYADDYSDYGSPY